MTPGDSGTAGPWAGGWWLCFESGLTCPRCLFPLAHWHLREMKNHFHIVMIKTPSWAQNMGGKGGAILLANAGCPLPYTRNPAGQRPLQPNPCKGQNKQLGGR